MTVRLLCAYDKYPGNAIVTLAAGTETGLVNAKMASTDLTGGVPFYVQVTAPAPVRGLVGGGPVSLKIGEQATCTLPEGQALSVTGGAASSGTVQRLDASGAATGTPWTVGAAALPPIGPFAGIQKILITCTAGSIDATVGDAVLGAVLPQSDVSGALRSLNAGGAPILGNFTNPRRRMVYLGDSLTWGGAPGRATGFYDGRTWYVLSTPVLTNLGNNFWLIYCMVEGTAGTAGGTLQTDGTGKLQWKYSTDSYGPLVDVSQGGFFYLSSGTLPNSGIFVAVRGATAAPSTPGTGAVTTTGVPNIGDYNLLGWVAWVAGALGETFSDHQSYAIASSTSADVLKFAPQALIGETEAVCLLAGRNDLPTTAAQAAATIANIKAIIDLARVKARRVYVLDTFPCPLDSATIQKFHALVSNAIRAYCRTKSNVRFCSAYDKMFAPNASSITSYTNARAGVYHTDSLHLLPYGAWLAAQPVVAAVRQDYPLEPIRRAVTDVWDSTLQVGSLNLNPALRGTAGTVTASSGITGTVPDSWILSRSGTTQTCTTSFDAATDGGLDWWSMSVAGSTLSGDYHMLKQTVAIPAGVSAGDYVRITCEFQVFSTTAPGLGTLQAQINSNGNIQSDYLFQTTFGRNVSTFTTELPTLRHTSEPMLLQSGITSFDCIIRVGADPTGGTGAGKVGFREFRLEKVPGPIAP